jgi:hypothetical protein
MTAPTCSTGKARFGTEGAALRRLAQIQDAPRAGSLYVPTGAIDCRRCGGFHLTSSDGRPARGRRGRQQRGRRR